MLGGDILTSELIMLMIMLVSLFGVILGIAIYALLDDVDDYCNKRNKYRR